MSISPLHGPRGVESFDDLYKAYFPRVVALLARRYPACDAEDIAQETMARCYLKFDELDRTRDPWGLVCTIACNAAVDSLRRTGRVVATEELPEVPSATDLTYEAVLVGERQRTVRAALARLRPEDRQLIEDHELSGIACGDMAAVRDIAPNALRQKLFRARNRLAAELRHVGAALGTVPVSVQARAARLARRLDDVAAAAGPAGATALSVAAVAGLATFGSLVTGPAGRPAESAARPASATTGVPHDGRPAPVLPPWPAAVPAAVPTAGPTPPTPTNGGPTQSPSASPAMPISISPSGDPVNDGRRPSSETIYLDTPVGEYEIRVARERTAGYGLLCNLGFTEYCPEGS